MKFSKRHLSRFTNLCSHLTDIYHRLYWQNSGLVRKYFPEKKPTEKNSPLKSNSLDDQLNHHRNFRNTDDEIIDYFINGGEVESDDEL